MEKFYYEKPTIKRKNDAIEYIDEFYIHHSKINGDGGLNKYIDNYSYEDWLVYLENMLNKDIASSFNRVPSITYFFVRKEDDRIIGMTNIRLELNDKLKKFGGHIGYGIRPSERRKGYNKINLYLALLECKKYSINKVMIDCDEDNIGSDKTIQALGGELERIEKDPNSNTVKKIYWIDVEKSIEKYNNIYKERI